LYAQPLYVPDVAVPGQGTHNIVYLATEHNSVYAFDADDPEASAPLWLVNLGAAVYTHEVSPYTNLHPEMGITGTPVIDPASGTMYVVAYTSEAGDQVYRLHALDIATGQEKFNGPTLIQASSPGSSPDSVGGTITLNPHTQLQRPALLLLNGVLYIAFGSHADIPTYHGWVLTYGASTLRQMGVYNTTPSGTEGAIWQSGQGLTVDDQGSSYFLTANGTSTTDGVNISEAFAKLPPTGSSLALADWYMVSNEAALNSVDEDLGSGGALYIPGSGRLIGGGKQGVLYVLDTSNLGHFGSPLQTLPACFGHIHGSPVYWNSSATGQRIYVWCENSFLEAFNFKGGLLSATMADVGTIKAPAGMPGGMLSISSNGSAAGTGIVWAAIPFNADAVHQTVEGVLRAFDAANLSHELWDSKQNDTRDDVGDFAKYTPPLIANGKVYVATFSGQLIVYGLLPAPLSQPDSYAINAGGAAEGAFQADSKFTGGVTANSGVDETFYVDPKAVANPSPQLVYRTARQGNFTYRLSSLIPGNTYAVRLQFVEFQSTAAGQRLFNVSVNGMQVLTNFDIYATAGGPNAAVDSVFTANADVTGAVTLQFTNGSAGSAQVNGIEIAPVESASATFVGVDSKTQGDWIGSYGTNGYNVVGYGSNYPAYANVSATAENLWVWNASSPDVRALKKLPPATDGIVSAWYASTNFVLDVNLTDGATHKVSLYLLDWDTSNLRSENIDVLDAATGTVLASQTVTSFSAGKYLSFNLRGHVQIRFAAMSDKGNTLLSGVFFDPLSSSVTGGGKVSFIKTDTVTQGNWKTAYGTGGYDVINDSENLPPAVQLSSTGTPFTWSPSTTDPRGLQKGALTATDRIAACLYAASSFTIDVNLTDGSTQQMSLYFLDWDNAGRSEKVELLDAASGAVLNTQQISSFTNGKYLIWDISGHVTIRITSLVTQNAVVSGIFFDPPAAAVTFAGTDAATEGTWRGVYGADGYNIINGAVSYPGYAVVSATNQQPWTWSSSTMDARALQNPAGAGVRLAACWFNNTSFTIDVSLTDGATHQVSLYFLDWDNINRSEKIELLNGSGAVLDTREISSFANGIYLTWNVSGYVAIRITNELAGKYILNSLLPQNAVVSGIFFGR